MTPKRTSPISYSDALADLICERIAGGESLRLICQGPKLPAFQTVLRWVNSNEGFAAKYLLAQDHRCQMLCDEILEIADTPQMGERVKTTAQGTETVTVDCTERSKLRLEARKWVLARMAPKRYGNRVLNEISGPEGAPLAAAGPKPKTAEEIQNYSAELYAGFVAYRDDLTGESLALDAEGAASLAESLTYFISNPRPCANPPRYIGQSCAMIIAVQRKIEADIAEMRAENANIE